VRRHGVVVIRLMQSRNKLRMQDPYWRTRGLIHDRLRLRKVRLLMDGLDTLGLADRGGSGRSSLRPL